MKLKNMEIADELILKFMSGIKGFWLGIPKFLRYLTVSVIIAGAIYFLWAKVIMSYDMASLEAEVAKLNEKCSTTVFYDRYTYDIANLIIVTKNQENEIDLMYEYHEEMLSILMEFFQKHHASDEEYQRMLELSKRTKRVKKSYERVFEHQVSQYDDWVVDPKNYDKVKVEVNEDGQRKVTNLDAPLSNKKHGLFPFTNENNQ